MNEKRTTDMKEQAKREKDEDQTGRGAPGSTIDAENQDQTGADHSPARQKDRARDEPKGGTSEDAGPEEDSYD